MVYRFRMVDPDNPFSEHFFPFHGRYGQDEETPWIVRGRGIISDIVYKGVNRGGQFPAAKRRTFGADKALPRNALRWRRTFGAEVPNCPRPHAHREMIPEGA